MAIKILVVDDHELVSTGISRLLQDVAGIEVVGCACSGEEAIKQVKSLMPDIVLMDINMPGIGGLGATREILSRHPNVKVIAISSIDDNPYPTRLMEMGASGYVTKGAQLVDMLQAIHVVSKGERYISGGVAQKMALENLSMGEANTLLSLLSEREIQIAHMILSCMRSNEIADSLNISSKTVNTYRYRIFEKLKISSDVELVLLAVRHGIFGLRQP